MGLVQCSGLMDHLIKDSGTKAKLKAMEDFYTLKEISTLDSGRTINLMVGELCIEKFLKMAQLLWKDNLKEESFMDLVDLR